VKFSRAHYHQLLDRTAAERLAYLEDMKGVRLSALMHYAKGCEESTTRDEIMGLVLVVAAERYLAKQAAKAAKRVKRIL
jgi:hypothetical protein